MTNWLLQMQYFFAHMRGGAHLQGSNPVAFPTAPPQLFKELQKCKLETSNTYPA